MRVMMEMMEMKEFSFFPTQKAKCGRQAWTPTGTFDVEQGYDDDVEMQMIDALFNHFPFLLYVVKHKPYVLICVK